MKVLDFDTYKEFENDLKKQRIILLYKVSEYIKLNDIFRNRYKLYDVLKVDDLYYDSLRDYHELIVSIKGNFYKTSKFIKKDEYDDINLFVRDTEKYKLEKDTNKFSL